MEKENASLHADQRQSASSGNMSVEVMSKIVFVLVCLVSLCMFCVDLVDLCPPRQGQRMCFWVGSDTLNADSVILMIEWWSDCRQQLVGEWCYIVHIPKDLFVLEVVHENLNGGWNQNPGSIYLDLSSPDLPIRHHSGVEKVLVFNGNPWINTFLQFADHSFRNTVLCKSVGPYGCCLYKMNFKEYHGINTHCYENIKCYKWRYVQGGYALFGVQ